MFELGARPIRAPRSSDDADGRCTMGEKGDQVKGRVKEAAGALTGDTELESEGKADRRAGEAKEKVGHVKDKVEAVIEKAEDKAGEVIDKAKEALHRKRS
jgi:uncharacterized protein YjbJ (UPF0337 family)